MIEAFKALNDWLYSIANPVLTPAIAWLNSLANPLGRALLGFVADMPGWVSATLIAVPTGIVMILVFKYTSPQRAIKKVRADMKASLLTLKLFKDSPRATMGAQGRLFASAFWLLVYALVPMVVMLVPVLLMMGQMSLWYQSLPLAENQEAYMVVKLNGGAASTMPDVRLLENDAIKVVVGPVRVPTKREMHYKIKAVKPGYQHLVFQVGEDKIDKELTIGDGYMRVSTLRPAWVWYDALLYPWEAPFPPDSVIQSITITHPVRSFWGTAGDSKGWGGTFLRTFDGVSAFAGLPTWISFWFVVSMIAALIFAKPFKVNF